MAFFTSAQDFFVPNSQSKISNYFKNLMSPEPFISHAKTLPAKRSENGYGDENGNHLELLVYDSL